MQQIPIGIQIRQGLVRGTIGGLSIVAADKLRIGPWWLYLLFILGSMTLVYLVIDMGKKLVRRTRSSS